MDLVILSGVYFIWGIVISAVMYVATPWFYGRKKSRHATIVVAVIFFWFPIVIATIISTILEFFLFKLKGRR